MSNTDRAVYYQALKASGVTFDRHFREYTTDELRIAYNRLTGGDVEDRIEQPEMPGLAPEVDDEPAVQYVPAAEPPPPPEFFGLRSSAPPPPAPTEPVAPTATMNPTEMAGERLNTTAEGQPIRTDENGRVWYQEEIRKPAYPKPRGRRVLTYMDPGVETRTVRSGDYIESFEVAGSGTPRPAEVKITLPSYQVGIYADPRFPFKIHVYNEMQGFDLLDVQDYYGGAELVPAEAKRVYVENVLCYDIRTTVRAIEAEYRQLQLTGKITE